MTRKGARLVLRYDAASQTFRGTVTNTTNAPLSRVRVEVHLTGGPELGPTKPTDLAPGETIMVSLDATGQSFSTWSPHPEVGPGSPVDPTGTSTFAPSLGGWAVIGGVDLGIEHQGYTVGDAARHAEPNIVRLHNPRKTDSTESPARNDRKNSPTIAPVRT